MTYPFLLQAVIEALDIFDMSSGRIRAILTIDYLRPERTLRFTPRGGEAARNTKSILTG